MKLKLSEVNRLAKGYIKIINNYGLRVKSARQVYSTELHFENALRVNVNILFPKPAESTCLMNG